MGAVRGAGKNSFCSRLGATRKALWSRFGAARNAIWSTCNTISGHHGASLISLRAAVQVPCQLRFIYLLYQAFYRALEPTPNQERTFFVLYVEVYKMRSYYLPLAPASAPRHYRSKVKRRVKRSDNRPCFVSGKWQCLCELPAAFRKTRCWVAFFISNSGFSAYEAEHSLVFARHRVARVDKFTP